MSGPGFASAVPRCPLDDMIDSPEPTESDASKRERAQLNAEEGERLMMARMRAHWSRRALANALGVARQTLIAWEESGASRPKPAWVDAKLKRVAPDVARELFRSHAIDLRSAG